MPRFFRHRHGGFTLVEMLLSIVALTLFVLMVTRLVKSASTITTIGNKHMGADSAGRSVLDRMAVDFSQMVKRTDVDYFLKGAAGGTMSGNDQIAFYSQGPGYYPSSGSQSPVSLVSYRVNSDSSSKNYLKAERLGKGLLWNGVSTTYAPVVFLPLTLAATWPAATNGNPDSDYEVAGPQVFRFEYYYLLTSGAYSVTPWDTNAGHNAVNGFKDVSAIGVTIAVIDPQSRVLISDPQNQLGTLITQMGDFSPTMQPGALDALWQSAVNATTAVPRPAASAIRIYSRLFPISH